MGTFVKRDDTPKLTNSSFGFSFTPAMISTKCLQFLTNESVQPVKGEMGWAMCLDSLEDGELMQEIIDLSGVPSL